MNNVNYQFYVTDNKVICVAYVSKNRYFKASAVCHPEDKFDEQFGMDLAKARVDVKIAKDTLEFADRKYDYATNFLNYAQSNYELAVTKMTEAQETYREGVQQLEKITRNF